MVARGAGWGYMGASEDKWALVGTKCGLVGAI